MARRPLPKRGRKPTPLVGEGGSSGQSSREPGEGFRSKPRHPSPEPKSDTSDFGHSINPNSGKPEFGGERGKRICVAQIGAAHGIRGEVRLRSFTEDPLAVASYGTLESEDGMQHFKIETLRPAKGIFVARLAGINDRNAAERLTNLKLYVPRDRLPPMEDADTFYHADLVGLAAVAPNGTALGTVSAIHRFGAGDLVEITPPDGGETFMVPFNNIAVPTIDIAGGRIVVVPPEISE